MSLNQSEFWADIIVDISEISLDMIVPTDKVVHMQVAHSKSHLTWVNFTYS